MPNMPEKLMKSRKARNATKLKQAKNYMKAIIAGNAEGLQKPKMPKYQKS